MYNNLNLDIRKIFFKIKTRKFNATLTAFPFKIIKTTNPLFFFEQPNSLKPNHKYNTHTYLIAFLFEINKPKKNRGKIYFLITCFSITELIYLKNSIKSLFYRLNTQLLFKSRKILDLFFF